MLVSHIKNLWTLPPPTTWPQEAPPIGWLCRQPIQCRESLKGAGLSNSQHHLVFLWVSKKDLYFWSCYSFLTVMLATARLELIQVRLARGAHWVTLPAAYCVMHIWCGVQTCLFCRLIRFSLPPRTCGSQQSEFYGHFVYCSSSSAPGVQSRAFRASQTHGSLACPAHVAKQEWLTWSA